MSAKDIFLIPNLLSLARVFLAPFAFYLLSQTELSFLLLILLVAVVIISDFLDGALARRLNQSTQLGLILDPLGDKLCLAAAVLALLISARISLLFFAIIAAKDLVIAIAGIFLIRKTKIIPPSNRLGKWTTGFLACGIGLFALLESIDGTGTHSLISALAWVARMGLVTGVFLAILSLAGYAMNVCKNPDRLYVLHTRLIWLCAILAAATLCFLLLMQLPADSYIVNPWYWI
ncbi:MAG: CDP-alcohol phosphatidyltransferase family protein [Spirochaetota bacterium]|jgi:CDP-diacylglycerol--glycerol-3-phosphate 3-phosphatidyltransferase|nr:CDP-alcohol phosphatidyltransferase family protein [Spirochaetota bacterium]